MAHVNLPHIHRPRTLARSNEVNENFQAILDQINGGLDNTNFGSSSIGTLNYIDRSVTRNKIAENAVGGFELGPGVVADVHVSSTAAIALAKLAALASGRALVSDADGVISVADITATELGYLDGITSNIQEQLDSESGSGVDADTFVKSGGLWTGELYAGYIGIQTVAGNSNFGEINFRALPDGWTATKTSTGNVTIDFPDSLSQTAISVMANGDEGPVSISRFTGNFRARIHNHSGSVVDGDFMWIASFSPPA